MVATLPLPRHLVQYFPTLLISILQQFAFYSFAAMLVIPWLFCVYRLVVVPLGRQKRVKYTLNELTAPKVVVVMPVYKEPPDSLWRALNSVVNCDYPAACIHVFVSFDGDDIDELYLKTIDRLGMPVTLKDFPKSIDVAFNGARVTVSRFPHGGKRHCQKATFLLIDKIYKRYLQEKDDLFILFIDSDCILDPVCIQNFMYDMELRPGSKHNMLAMTGIITSSTKKHSFITLLQDMEYVHGQLFERSVESGCGAVTCLPGALTLLRFSAFRNMARFYFSDKAEECEDLFDYAKTHLGEDRWLTHLFMLGAKQRYQIQLSTSAFCKTEAVQTFRSLLKQRRRWFLGFITNEVCMLTDGRLWRKYPMLCLLRFATITIRTTALLLLITIISISSTSTRVDSLPWEFMCISCGLNWLLMFYFAIRLHRWKAALYPMMFMLNPFLNWVYMVYGVFTAGQRTWGGPRADAGAADAKVTPQQAIEHAIATGDDLNIVPETFKPAIEFRRRRTRPSALQPSSSVEGRFFSAEQEPGQLPDNDVASTTPTNVNFSSQQHRYEHESLDMSDSDSLSVHTPKWINNFSEDEERGSRQSREAHMEPRPRSMVTDLQQRMRESHSAARNTVAVIPALQDQRDLYTPAEPRDVRQGMIRIQHIDNRSPLGRNSPLMAVSVEEDVPALEMEEKEDRDMADIKKVKRRSLKKHQRLRKRSPSPGKMV
ncbi:chitin synthase [Cladophialophora psammophila CBS 110553]|uniref:chitin synthase n=1 Tax=Cladophialophora psammophila CBS 110553 TaxID=1182543 RepID=W9XGK9_9EURO|nr:chitin synthase [Cladophialophora psammophila CBS 110553]EXJ69504.1 chitin synthase [Cladophialophora psammophila CBS 110553]